MSQCSTTMALTSLVKPSSLVPSTKDILNEYNGLHRSHSSKVLCSRANFQPSLSSLDNHLCYCINRIHATLPEHNKSPNLLRSYAFDPESSRHMNTVENDCNEVENSLESSEGKELKRISWFESLVKFGRNNWKNFWQKEAFSGLHNYYDEERRCRSYDREVFSRFLVKVPWSDTKSLSHVAFLCNLAYITPEMKATDLKRNYGLDFVTSPLHKEAQASAAYLSWVIKSHKSAGEKSCTNRGSSAQNNKSVNYKKASTMTSMLEEGEKEKQGAALANDIQSLHSLPCEWFVCDDPTTYTRIFVIQGINTLASWQAYFFFEPIEFEGTSVLVHRGIYELAKKIYQHFEPEIMYHLARHGEQAKLQFTGHCLGGSLSVIIHLMLLTRKVVKPSTLLPVVTFGSPYVFCGGQKIFEQLGLDESNHIHAVMLHRDIVPRSFSSNYPNHVTAILKSLNSRLKSHPCLTKNTLYSPIGKLFIVQPEERSSPPHPLLPLGSALYALDRTRDGFCLSVFMNFLNSPHPLETLSNLTAYGSEGTILRDHDSSNYMKAMNGVLRLHTRKVVRSARKRSNISWPLLDSPPPNSWNHEDESDIES